MDDALFLFLKLYFVPAVLQIEDILKDPLSVVHFDLYIELVFY